MPKPIITLDVPDAEPVTLTHDGSTSDGDPMYFIDAPGLTPLDLLALARAIVDRFGRDYTAQDVQARLTEMGYRS